MKTEILKAKLYWIEISHFRKIDDHFSNSMINENYPISPRDGWISLCRKASLLSQTELAEKTETSRQGFAKMEFNESDLSITLANLKKAAAALDCELVYFFRPKSRKRFSDLLWEKLLPEALAIYKRNFKNAPIRPRTLALVANKLLADADFRKKMNWTQQRPDRP